MIGDYFSIAVNNLLQRRLRSYLTMIGIFIGIAAVVALIGLGEGLRTAITGQFGSFGPDKLSVQAGGVQAGPPGTGVIDPLTTDDAEAVEDVNGVKMVIPRMVRSVSVDFNDISKIGYLSNMVDGEKRDEIERVLDLKIEEGRFLKDGDKNKIVVAHNFADGERFKKQMKVGDSVLIEDKNFDIVGILKKKGSFIFDNIILMNEDPMRDLLDDHEKVDVLAVIVEDMDEIGLVKNRIEKLMRNRRDVKVGEEDFEVQSPEQALGTINDTLFAVQLFVSLIAGISLVVGGIGILNTMYTAVLERTREIGIMKSIGATNRAIFTMFFIESGLLGTLGGIVGVVLGLSMASGLSYLGRMFLGSELIQANFSPWLIIGSLLFSFILGSLAGITPALQAAKLHPVDALRYKK